MNRPIALAQVVGDIRDVIRSACPKPEDQENLWREARDTINADPFDADDPRLHPSLTAEERNR